MIKKSLPIIIFILLTVAAVLFSGFLFKQLKDAPSKININGTTPRENFQMYLNAAYNGDWKAIKTLSITNAELETDIYSAFFECIEVNPAHEKAENQNKLYRPEKEPRDPEIYNKDSDSYFDSYDISEDETVPVVASGFALSLNASKISPRLVKVIDTQIYFDEAVITFIIADRNGNTQNSEKQKMLFKKTGDVWKIIYVTSVPSEADDVKFAIPKPFCK